MIAKLRMRRMRHAWSGAADYTGETLCRGFPPGPLAGTRLGGYRLEKVTLWAMSEIVGNGASPITVTENPL